MASGDTSCMQTDMSQLQHVEEQDSVASGDTSCMQTDMSQLQHVEEDSLVNGDRPCRQTCPSFSNVEEDSLASGDPPVNRHLSQVQQC